MADRAVDPTPLPRERSTGEIIRDILADIQNIIHAEIRLARAELAEKAQRAGRAGGLLGAAAFAGLFAGACFVVTCIAALAVVMPVWLAALIMGICISCLALGLYVGGRHRLQRVDLVPQRTVQTIRDDVQWAKQRTR